MAQIINGVTYRHLAYIEFKPDASRLRGNHYHNNKTEVLYIIKGMLLAKYHDLDDGQELEVTLGTGDLVTIQPRCAHVYSPLAYTQAIEISATSYDPKDTLPFDL